MMTHIIQICEHANVTTGQVSLYTDCESAVNFLSFSNPYVKTSTKHFDMLAAITRAIKATKITWNFIHVKGHQDDVMDYNESSREAQLNVLADHLAKQKMTECLQLQNHTDLQDRVIPYSPINAYWLDSNQQRHLLYSALSKSLHSHIHTLTMRDYMTSKAKY